MSYLHWLPGDSIWMLFKVHWRYVYMVNIIDLFIYSGLFIWHRAYRPGTTSSAERQHILALVGHVNVNIFLIMHQVIRVPTITYIQFFSVSSFSYPSNILLLHCNWNIPNILNEKLMNSGNQWWYTVLFFLVWWTPPPFRGNSFMAEISFLLPAKHTYVVSYTQNVQRWKLQSVCWSAEGFITHTLHSVTSTHGKI